MLRKNPMRKIPMLIIIYTIRYYLVVTIISNQKSLYWLRDLPKSRQHCHRKLINSNKAYQSTSNNFNSSFSLILEIKINLFSIVWKLKLSRLNLLSTTYILWDRKKNSQLATLLKTNATSFWLWSLITILKFPPRPKPSLSSL